MSPEYERLNRWIDQLQADEHPDIPPGDDPEEADLFLAASTWAAARPGADEPDPAFLARLRGELLGAGAPHADAGTPGTPGSVPPPVAEPVAAGAAPVAPQWSAPAASMPAPMANPPSDPRVIRRSGLWDRRVSRRNLLTTMSAAAAGLVAGLGLEGWFSQQAVAKEIDELHEIYGTSDAPQGSLAEGQGKWFAVAHVNEVQVGEAIPIRMGGVKGFLLRVGAQQFDALSGVCTHLGCDLSWVSGSHSFNCGCHGSSFDSTGKPLTGPALYPIPLRHLPVFSWKIQDDVVYVLA